MGEGYWIRPGPRFELGTRDLCKRFCGVERAEPLSTVPYVTATPPGPSDVQKVDKIKGI